MSALGDPSATGCSWPGASRSMPSISPRKGRRQVRAPRANDRTNAGAPQRVGATISLTAFVLGERFEAVTRHSPQLVMMVSEAARLRHSVAARVTIEPLQMIAVRPDMPAVFCALPLGFCAEP